MTKTEQKFGLQLQSPNGTTAIVGIPKSNKEIATVTVNNTLVWQKGKMQKSKSKDFRYDSEDTEYLKFKAKAGNWKVDVVYDFP